MPSMLTSLGEALAEDYSAVKQNPAADERIKGYNLGQLYGLRRHTKAAVDGQPPGVLRSANLLFLEKLEVEIAQREVVLRAHLAKKAEEDAKEAKEREHRQFKKKEKELLIRMHQAYARIAAEKEIRATEEQKMLEEKAKLDGRRVEAVKWRSRLYALSLCMGGLGAGLWFVLKNDVLSIIVVAVCALAMVGLGVKGYLKGEEWRMKVVTEKMIEDKIERRAEELVVGIHAEYRARVKEEKALKAAERAEKKRKRLEREEKRRQEERRLAQSNVKALEEGRLRIMQQMLAEQEDAEQARRAKEEEDEYARELLEAQQEMEEGGGGGETKEEAV